MPHDLICSSICDIELLMIASQATYRIVSDHEIQEKPQTSISNVMGKIAEKNYNIFKIKYQSHNHLCALTLEPVDDRAPIVIAFRGTKTRKDMLSDMSIVARGVAVDKLRAEAWGFYEAMRKDFPGKKMVLTGHSLGGHLAQYVAARAYHQDEHVLVRIEVRTFNSAPIDTKHGRELSADTLSHFVHYRFAEDLMHKLPFNTCYGDVYIFKAEFNNTEEQAVQINHFEQIKKNHSLKEFYRALSPHVKALRVGHVVSMSPKHVAALEKIKAMQASDAYYVSKKWFLKSRIGKKSLSIFNQHSSQLTGLFDPNKTRTELCVILNNSSDAIQKLTPYIVHDHDAILLKNFSDKINQLYMDLKLQDFHENRLLAPHPAKKCFEEFGEILLELNNLEDAILFEGKGGTPEESTCLFRFWSQCVDVIRNVLDLFTCFFTWLFVRTPEEPMYARDDSRYTKPKQALYVQNRLTSNEDALIREQLSELSTCAEAIVKSLREIDEYDRTLGMG
tara:strand:+ start:6695 stop:8209 length:1515 start_codon:yes stop_codon:yes gene_type:complete